MSKLAYGALWIFVFTISSEPTFRGFGLIPTRITGPLALGLALLTIVVSGRLRRWHLFHIAAFLFVVWVGLGLMFFYNRWVELPNKFWTYVQLFLVAWIMWELAITRGRQLGLMAAYVFGAYVSAIDTISLFRRQAEAMRRFAAGGVDNNDLAMMLALAIPMAWYLGMVYQQPLRRWVFSAYLPVALFAIGLTGSRGGMLTTMVALLIVPLTMVKLSPFRRLIAIGLLWISGAVAVAYVPQTLIERLASTRAEVEGGGIGGRLKIWNAGLKAFVYKPLVGYGPGGFKRAIDPWLLHRSQVAHNSFLSVLVEQGLIGFLFFVTMHAAVGVALLRLPRLDRRFALIVLATLVVSTLPLSSEESKRVWFVLSVLLVFSQSQVGDGRGGRWPLRTGRAPIRARPLGSTGRREPVAVPLRNPDRNVAE